MKKPVRNNEREDVSFIDKLRGIAFIGLPLWIVLFFLCCIGISECIDRHEKKVPTPPPYTLDEVNKHDSREHPSSGVRHPGLPDQTEENKLIDKLYEEDYYDYSDYYDGLDGEHSDIDYNDIRDYFED